MVQPSTTLASAGLCDPHLPGDSWIIKLGKYFSVLMSLLGDLGVQLCKSLLGCLGLPKELVMTYQTMNVPVLRRSVKIHEKG